MEQYNKIIKTLVDFSEEEIKELYKAMPQLRAAKIYEKEVKSKATIARCGRCCFLRHKRGFRNRICRLCEAFNSRKMKGLSIRKKLYDVITKEPVPDLLLNNIYLLKLALESMTVSQDCPTKAFASFKLKGYSLGRSPIIKSAVEVYIDFTTLNMGVSVVGEGINFIIERPLQDFSYLIEALAIDLKTRDFIRLEYLDFLTISGDL